ncbi:tRNA (N(6)-L-threonylcarbamoyladenosine(37)-C(2))-methylthiotransferase MtaB [Bacteroidales bacterium OttesenSCG-928-B11]|nr:tRNA (N(6)-L-threonylcarbamoyladenosine(37)-C(2))-methylthiotransferase MtaB [Bacteroidales bacterium OttesenSCG-928-C03]MDL2311646.1 tRNA (N(6)-L-threonylcarbamoyladenosine(37)-C(2))-methylthiotransferase MtaB [Bacteroidales bacterium OttesenSCG-928-B11]
MSKKTFSIHTLGCKLNFSESSDIARQLREAGFQLGNSPDFIIINSCAVTETAVKKARNLVAKLHRQHPEAEIIIFGCYAALEPLIIRQWEGVSAVFGSADKHHVIPYLKGETLPAISAFTASFSSGDRTRSFLKVQDGCDYHCTYCTVAKARGESRSDTIAHVMRQLEKIATLGIQEVILTGVNLADFGRQNGEAFYNLLSEIEKSQLIPRIRISSVEPNLLHNNIIDLVANSNVIMPHFHIPLQSGSNRILDLMQRRYNRELFQEKINNITEKIPDAFIAIDIISGFPTETEEDFEDSYRFLKSLPLAFLHVFTYSKRPGTLAAAMPQVKDSVKKERTLRLLELSEQKKREFYDRFIGQTRPVLFESDNVKGKMFGFTDNYIKVATPYNAEWVNRVVEFQLTKASTLLTH